MKKHKILLLGAIYCLFISGCSTNNNNDEPRDDKIANSQYIYNLPEVNKEELTNLSSMHELGSSIYHSNRIKNAVQGYYSDSSRSSFIVKNSTMQLNHKLAGIWLAPFIGEEKSETFKNHPDWFIKKDDKQLKVGTNWSGFYALDFDKKEVKEYIKSELNYLINEVGFDFIKIDFLHAVCINHQNKSRAKQMYQALKFIRECAPNTLILGCGVPLASAFGIVDYCRVGPDVSLIFNDVWFMKFMHRERISTKITLQNTINRYYINGLGFNNDPDVYIMRKENVKLNELQKEALIIINFIFGSIYMTSDNIANYDASKKELMQKYQEFKHHKVISITYDKKYIKFVTEFNKNRYNFSYDTKKGELSYGKI